jgi:hypothetical protein
MLLAIVNLVLSIWLYFYLAMIHDIGCTCAITPTYYYIAYYVILSLVIFAFNSFIEKSQTMMIVMINVYFFSTMVFLFLTFKYVKEIEACACAGPNGAIVLQMLFWVRLISLAMALSALATFFVGIQQSQKKIKR